MAADEAAPNRGDELYELLFALGEVLDEVPALQPCLVRPSEAVDVVECEPDAPPDERERGPRKLTSAYTQSNALRALRAVITSA